VIEDEQHQPIAYLTPVTEKLDREDWAQVARAGLNGAYGDNEPDYSSSLIKEPNAEYEGR
jgi:hypothetical protein